MPSFASSCTRRRQSGQAGTATGTDLDRVDRGTDRDVAEGQVVPQLDVGPGTVLDAVTLLQVARGEDVVDALAVGVVQQRDARGAVGVVLDVRDLRRHAVLVVTTEVDHSVGALVSATLVAGTVTRPALLRPPLLCSGRTSDFSGVDRVTSTKSATEEPHGGPASSACTCGFPFLSPRPILGPGRSVGGLAEDVDTVALSEGHDGALGVSTLTKPLLVRLRLP